MKNAKLSRQAKWMFVLSVVSLGLFVFSCRQWLKVTYASASGAYVSASLCCGELRLDSVPVSAAWGPATQTGFNFSHESGISSTAMLAWRPYHIAAPAGSGYLHDGVAIPLWPLVAAALIAAGYCLGFRRAARISDRTHCSACGYDLRGLPKPAGGGAGAKPICPECGGR